MPYAPYHNIDVADLLCGVLPPHGCMEGVLLERRQCLFDRITSDPPGLIEAMEKHGMILTGSAALAFALPLLSQKDFDFIIPFGSRESVLSTFTKWGYGLDTTEGEGKFAKKINPISNVHTITRLVTHKLTADDKDTTFSSIYIIESTTSDVLQPLFSFHTTASMIFLSSRAFFMAYPELTLTKRNAASSAYISPSAHEPDLINVLRQFKMLNKYEDKGFTSITYPYPSHNVSLHTLCGKKFRSIHDQHSLYVILDKTCAGVPAEDGDNPFNGSWRLGGIQQTCDNCVELLDSNN